MKKLVYLSALFAVLIAFSGCYADRGMVYQRPPARVIVGDPYYYHSSPVYVEPYRNYGYRGSGRHRIRRHDRY